jgi:hypothetical protein
MRDLPERLRKNRRLVLTTGGGAFAVLLLVVAVTALITRRNSAAAAGPAADAFSPQTVIPGDELFLPEEPDFVPGVLLERERRGMWTAEDAAPWWQDPLKNGEEPWRGRIEMTVDELLERVP